MLAGGLAAAAALVVVSGVKLTRYGDGLGEVLNLSKTWVGVILLAISTSLPELVVTLSAQLAVAKPQFAMSNVCGSNLINLCIFVVLDFFAGPYAITARLGRSLVRPAVMGLVCMAVAMAGLSLKWVFPGGNGPIGWVVSGAILAVAAYAFIRTETSDEATEAAAALGHKPPKGAARKLLARFIAATMALVVCGIALIYFADALADRPIRIGGTSFVLGDSVVGTLGLALVTSLPELVVCLTAVRMGALDMAVGNLLGSNIFNILLLPLAHVVRPMRDFWAEAEWPNQLSLAAAMVMTLIFLAGLRARSKRHLGRLGLASLLMGLIGGAALAVVAVRGVRF